MEKINGRYHGSCHECGHAIPLDNDDTPIVHCVPRNDLLDKYEKGCPYLVPRCEHNEISHAELSGSKKKMVASGVA